MIRTEAKPRDHWEGHWVPDKKYTLYSLVYNNGSVFRAINAKSKDEPYVTFDKSTGTYGANDGWEVAILGAAPEHGGAGGGASILEVTDIEALTTTEIDNLKPGDLVVKKSGEGANHTYLVAYKDTALGELSLVYADAWNVEEVYYEKNDGVWSFIVKDISAISNRQEAPASSGTAGQILALNNEGKPTWVNPAEGSVVDDSMSDESENPVQNKVIKGYVDTADALKADKSEMSVTDGTGSDADKTTIQLKSGTSAVVLKSHQDISGKADKSYVDDNFAKKDGYYSTLTSGAAENLVGRGTVPAEVNYRTSGGEADLGSGSATITKVKGKSIVWNQQVRDTSISGSATQAGAQAYIIGQLNTGSHIFKNHVAYIRSGKVTVQNANGKTLNIQIDNQVVASVIVDSDDFTYEVSALATITHDEWHEIRLYIGSLTADQGVVISWENVNAFDLTEMFGSGNEPSSADAFVALYSGIYANNDGSVRNNTATGLKTIGFNQFDEDWEDGGLSDTTGAETTTANLVRSKNFVPVFNGKEYHCFTDSGNPAYLDIYCYDSDKKYIGKFSAGNQTFTFGTKAYTATSTVANNGVISFVRFRCYNVAQNPGRVCLNLSWSGYRNGEYEPYWSSELALNLTTFTGKKDGEGESVTIFGADGMKSLGAVYDETDGKTAEKRLGIRAYESGDESDNTVITDGTNTIYVLDAPEHYVLDTPINLNYRVDDFGTEAKYPADTASAVSAPLCYDVKYAMNAVDTLRRLGTNYIKKASMDHILTAFKTAGIIADYTLTYDATNDDYTCTVTAPSTT